MENDLQKKALFLKIMKLTLSQLILLLIMTGVSVAASSNAQEILDTKVTLDIRNQSMKEILREIESKVDVKFAYSKGTMQSIDGVSIRVVDAKLSDVLDTLLAPRHMRYQVIGDQIILNQIPREQSNLKAGQHVSNDPADAVVSGTISDDTGSTIPGVNVILKGTTLGTVSDVNGRYALTVPDLTGTLIFSYIGYISTEVPIQGRTGLDITLAEDVTNLDEIVVVGYGTQKKESLTGSVTIVDAELLEDRPITNASQALQGAQGVYVNQAGGQPGADNATIRIRGVGTLNDNNPLVLVNGVEYSLSDVNPNDIESISILKDASAAIYGSRAANGVILIKTKGGQKGKIELSYNNYFGLQKATSLPDMVTNSVDWMISRNQASINEGQPIVFSDAQIEEYRNGTDRDIYPNTDWFDVMFRVAPVQEHNFRLSGGGDNITYSVSLGYLDQDGIMINTDAKKYSLSSNIGFDISKRLKGGVILSTTYWDRNELGRTMTGGGDAGVMGSITRALPIHPTILADGRYGDTWLKTPGHNIFRNPLANAESTGNTRTQRSLANIFVEYTFPLDVTYKVNFAVNKYDALESQFIPEVFIYDPKDPSVPKPMTKDVRSAHRWDDNNLNTSFFQTLSWTGNIAERNRIDVLVGVSRETFGQTNFDAYIEGFFGNELTELNAGNLNKDLGGTSSDSRLMSYFGRTNYSYADKYLLEASFRYDGSSRFAKSNRWGFFPSVSAGWRIAEEAFMQNVRSISNLKLRASWGQLGNQNVPLYSFVNSISIGEGYSFHNGIVPGAAVTGLADPGISWETTTITNVGVDVGLWNGKLELTADIFNKLTTDILARVNVPAQVGNLTGPVTNLYSMSNKGAEISANHANAIGTINYRIGGNVALVNNNVDFLNGDVQYANNAYGNITIIKEGYPVNSYFLYEALGMFKTPEEVTAHAYQGPDTAPGDVKYRDLNDDGTIDSDDRMVTGRSVPRFTYGFNLSLSFRGFDLGAFFQGVEGIDTYPTGNIAFPNYNGAGITKDQLADSWTPENPDASLPRLTLPKRGSQVNYKNSTLWQQDASYLRLKNLQVGYSLPSALTGKINIKKVRVFANAQNFLTFSKYKLTDPERNILQTDIYEYPTTKIFSLGCNVIF